MAAQPNTALPLVDIKKKQVLDRITKELARAHSSAQRFATISHRYDDGDPNTFFESVIDAANALNPPPHAVAPFYGEGRGRDPHSTAVACGVIISF